MLESKPIGRPFFRTTLTLTLIAILSLSLTGCTSRQIRTLASLRKVDSFPLYVLHYSGDYAFDEFLRKGAGSDRELLDFIQQKLSADLSLAPQPAACTMFAARNGRDEALTGRNFDFEYTTALLLYTKPSQGYASVSMVNLSYIGIIHKLDPTDIPKLLGTPYLPFDGMNDQGVCMGMLAVPSAEPPLDPRKPTLNTTTAIRLVLDHAKSTREAIALLRRFNIRFSAGVDCHFLVSDASGHSAVVEFIGGKMTVIPKTRPWQTATNFIMAGPKTEGEGRDRYALAEKVLKKKKGIVSETDAMHILEKVSMPRTLWSAVYNQKSGELSLVMGRKYFWVKKFRLKMK